jgi:hypothetical protein
LKLTKTSLGNGRVVFDFHDAQNSLSHSLSRPQESNLTVAKEFMFSLRQAAHKYQKKMQSAAATRKTKTFHMGVRL